MNVEKELSRTPIGVSVQPTYVVVPCTLERLPLVSPTAPGKDGDDIDGLRNQGTRDGDDGFLDQLLEPAQCSERGARMDGTDATRMSGAPGFEQVESLRTAHFPDWNAIGSKTQR